MRTVEVEKVNVWEVITFLKQMSLSLRSGLYLH